MMTQAVHLQAVGLVAAKPAQEFKVGEKMVWNFASVTEVVGIKNETASFAVYLLKDKNGKVWERKLKKSRLVAIAD